MYTHTHTHNLFAFESVRIDGQKIIAVDLKPKKKEDNRMCPILNSDGPV